MSLDKIPVIVNGASGRMGMQTVEAVRGADDLELVASTDLGDDLEKTIRGQQARVVVDFTEPTDTSRGLAPTAPAPPAAQFLPALIEAAEFSMSRNAGVPRPVS